MTVEEESPLQDEVAALLRQSDAVASCLYPGEFRRPVTPETLDKPGIHVVVARRGATVAGCCAVLDRGDSTAELKRMIVDKATRGQGVGTALLAGAETVARRIGAHTMVLEVGVRNTEAQALYRRAGYGPRAPFPPHRATPTSLFLERRL